MIVIGKKVGVMAREAAKNNSRTQQEVAASLLAGHSEFHLLAAMGPQQPTSLIRAFLTEARRTDTAIKLMFADLGGRFDFLDDQSAADITAGRLSLVALAGGIARARHAQVDYLPISLWDTDRLLRSGRVRVDAVLLRASPSANSNAYSYGDMIGYTPSALESGATAVIELDSTPDMQRHPSSLFLPSARADIVLNATEPPIATIATAPNAAQMAIGRHVAGLLPDGATLQLGLGSIAEAILTQLSGKRELGIHSGIVTPSLGRLIDAGIVTGREKSVDPGIVVATGIHGASEPAGITARAATAFRPVSETHDPQNLARQQRLWALNSALEVDLLGQVNAEFIKGARVASGGGQADFSRAAHLSEGGGSVIALPAMTPKGHSRIVAALPQGCAATSSAQDIDFVVTEYGVADLRGRSRQERAAALVHIADPTARPALLASLGAVS